jgi:hypothetical protein
MQEVGAHSTASQICCEEPDRGWKYGEKLACVRENPLRKNLVKTPENWPFQGIVHDLRWTAD